MKFYAVAVGREVGVFTDWATTSQAVNGYPGAKYKSFPLLRLANEFIAAHNGGVTPAIEDTPKVERAPGEIWVYTDGSFKNNACGYGVVVLVDDICHEICGPVPLEPTNNVAELYAIYVVLSMLRDHDLKIHSDSQYSIGCVSTWINGWMRNGWKTAAGQPVKNQELIRAIYELLPGRKVEFIHVKAHCGIEHNELADLLADRGRQGEEINTMI